MAHFFFSLMNCFSFLKIHHLSQIMRKPTFCICENIDADPSAVTAKLISAFVFATQIVQSLFFLNPKYQASSYLLWLYSPVCVGPGRKPECCFFMTRLICFEPKHKHDKTNSYMWCAQQRLRTVEASTESDQSLRCSH